MEDKIKVIFTGRIQRKKYHCDKNKSYDDSYYGEPYIRETTEILKYKKFYECEISKPPFKENEIIYINELDTNVTICEIIRSVNGEYICNTNYVIETIENDDTLNSKIKAQITLNEELPKYEKWQRKRRKKWWQFWK